MNSEIALVQYFFKISKRELLKSWYSIALLIAALTINENVVQWALAVQIGGYTVAAGFEDAFEYFTLFGYFFSTAFRLIPYVGLGMILAALSKTKLKDYGPPVFVGGLIGILAFIVLGLWTVLLPLYTDAHVSSTTPISFIFIPIYAIPAGAVGAIFVALLYTPIRFLLKRRKTG